MTDIKIRAIRDAKAPYTEVTVAKGEVLHFISNSRSASGEPWVRVKHHLAKSGEVYFEAKDFELVPSFKVGDQVVTSARMSGLGTRLSADAVYTVEDVNNQQGERMGLRRNGVGTYYAVPFDSVSLHKPKVSNVEKRNNPGWTFRAAPSDFDGPRILRELEAQGAQYAVIVWGKGQAERIAVISQDLDERSDAYAKATPGPSVLFSSTQALQDFGPGKAVIHSSSEWGWHEVTRPDESPARLGDLKALAGRVADWERADAKVRVYVAYGPAGGK